MATDENLWSSVPWQSFPPNSKPLAWHKHRVPYTEQANALQNLDVWIPTSSSSREPANLSSIRGLWVIYIHGGAWRDPLVTSASFTPTIRCLLGRTQWDNPSTSKIAAFASINYSLSPYPNHPTDPSPPKDPSRAADRSRTARHPAHILDVLHALAFLQRKAGFGGNYILLGHSCGATLTIQVLMDATRWGDGAASALKGDKPRAALGLNGLYDLPGLIQDPGEKHAHLIPIYAEFTKGAFGEDETVWKDVSPVSVSDWTNEWGRAEREVVLVQSGEDTLVPYRQLEGMREGFKSAGLKVLEMHADGDHDELWEKGDRLAEIIHEMVTML
ncbi:uncharacterized protein Z518_10468 [Rhinocladiella mackenziei CBS 650.93]|uniref:Kynurenine formamidase n=1 Tax=Rhinocladiella mackenziei CBS 650.93 TaxID=1442369 RepID=A0A0D2I3H7_9EURO|nr:uncharacterized protein Z518_10468 [Rhinocladiella mackenziei CBS 650.93]KIX00329.1 hypothetical protein Z518_10468 [Rhinocladiella mackenziei CBS 650.93]